MEDSRLALAIQIVEADDRSVRAELVTKLMAECYLAGRPRRRVLPEDERAQIYVDYNAALEGRLRVPKGIVSGLAQRHRCDPNTIIDIGRGVAPA